MTDRLYAAAWRGRDGQLHCERILVPGEPGLARFVDMYREGRRVTLAVHELRIAGRGQRTVYVQVGLPLEDDDPMAMQLAALATEGE